MIGVTIPGGAGTAPERAAAPSVFAAVISTVVAAVIILLDAVGHAGLIGHPDGSLDQMTLIALGAIFGVVPALLNRAQTIANTSAVLAAHQRLDAVHAPPANDGALTP